MIFLLCRNHHHAENWRKEQGMERPEFYNKVVVCATDDPNSFTRLRGRKFIPQRDRVERVYTPDAYLDGKYFIEVFDTLKQIGAISA